MPPKTRHDLIVLMREVTRDASFSQGRARTRTQRIADLATHPAAYVTVQAFAAYLGFQERSVRKWIDARCLAGVPVSAGHRRLADQDRRRDRVHRTSPVSVLVRGRLFRQIELRPGRLSFAAARFASNRAATLHTLAGIGRTPDVVATSAGVFKLDVQSANNAFATHKTDNAATDATGIRHGGERDRSRHRLSESDACANRADSQMRCGEVARGAPFSQGRARTRTQRIAYLVRSSAHFR
jgi:hypothetical protein